ncbi:efflux RND transporter permease subunit [Commensalibacter nepenthis]|uniref:Efflux pump membrane transporter n=1 Tax=Commensalibacter nepenthis TaxID=3043872 RepID=A0ABT6Q7D7_9PROT|nr:efflux RND transporter permease subunit [Commensalibacter sp. TBRC 10068]MDI2112801.1 efflux RND transporter permease subunit [Commensalibacter sp. TBRC 10068]
MSLSRFFIDRPIFAWVIAILISLMGMIAIVTLPIAQWPNIAPPPITLSFTYPGATADTVQRTVVDPVSQNLYGVDHLEYMSTVANADGTATITLTFEQGTNPDVAQVQVLNRVDVARSLLPSTVALQGIRISKSNKSYMMFFAIQSMDHSLNEGALGDLLASDIQNPITRLNGLGDYTAFSSEYAMRVWLDPDKLHNYQLNPTDVMNEISSQNSEQPLGEFGKLPALPDQRFDIYTGGIRRLVTPEEFGNIVIKTQTDGARIRLKDVATVALGPMSYQPVGTLDSQPVAAFGVKLSPGFNQLALSNAIHSKIEELSKYFPPNTRYLYPLDTSKYVVESMEEVVHTLIEAIILVIVVMYVFLQNFRATFIPTIAVPVVLLGTFFILEMAGFSINTLTMLALVLAIGLLVDDAIVVVENVERVMEEEHCDPKTATQKSMDQISGALVGIALVLSVVFIPMAFFSGSAGVVYRQFSLTIVSAMTLSVVVALIFTPALCATILKPHDKNAKTGRFFTWFNRNFEKMVAGYISGVKGMINHTRTTMVVYFGLTVGALASFHMLPEGFLPDEDQGVVFLQSSLSPGSSAAMTAAVNKQITDYFLKNEKQYLQFVYTAIGFNFGGQAQSASFGVARLKDFDQRSGGYESSAQAVAARAMKALAAIPGANVFAVLPPPVMDLGSATGFDFELLNRGHLDDATFAKARDALLSKARADKRLVAVRLNGLPEAPQYYFNIDRDKAHTQGVSIDSINQTLSIALGSGDAGLFNLRGRVKHVFVQGDVKSRASPDDLRRWFVRNNNGNMVPLTAFINGEWKRTPQKVETYNGYPSFEIMGQGARGVSNGTAMQIMEQYTNEVAKEIPGIGFEWTGMSYEQVQSSGQAGKLYALSILAVFLSLAALYESWAIPFSVLLVVPLGVIGAALATYFRGLDNDIYFQVGLLTTVGLAAKNAILIVEFAKEHFDDGKSLTESAILAAHERIRPILMTSLAFVLGVIPLAIATGAGAASHVAIGVAVVGGVITATVLALYFVPIFFILVLKLFKVKPHPINKNAAEPQAVSLNKTEE